jgi:hypothetical protein
MDMNRLQAILAAPLAGLFLILTLCAFALQKPEEEGMYLPITRVRMISDYYCPGVDRTILVSLHKDGSYWINEEQIPTDEFRFTLTEIYENRKQKILPVLADPDISYGDFARFYDEVISSTSDLHIILRTPQLEEQLHQCSPSGSCGIDWPDHSYTPCVYRSSPFIRPLLRR